MAELRAPIDKIEKFGWYERYWEKCYVGDDRDNRSMKSLLKKREADYYKEELHMERKKSVEGDQLADEIEKSRKK